MSLSYTADECRCFYRESKHKQAAVQILFDMNPSCSSKEMSSVLGFRVYKHKARQSSYNPLVSPLEKRHVLAAIKTYKYQMLAVKIIENYGSINDFCLYHDISDCVLRNMLHGNPCYRSTKDRILEAAGMTEEEAQKEWKP